MRGALTSVSHCKFWLSPGILAGEKSWKARIGMTHAHKHRHRHAPVELQRMSQEILQQPLAEGLQTGCDPHYLQLLAQEKNVALWIEEGGDT